MTIGKRKWKRKVVTSAECVFLVEAVFATLTCDTPGEGVGVFKCMLALYSAVAFKKRI